MKGAKYWRCADEWTGRPTRIPGLAQKLRIILVVFAKVLACGVRESYQHLVREGSRRPTPGDEEGENSPQEWGVQWS
jgi:hypothetical protein